jgi:hypothetical protein
MSDITTILTLTLLVSSGAIIISFALVMYAGFRMQNPPLSPFHSIVTIAVIFLLAYAVLNTRSCRAFFNHPVQEEGGRLTILRRP